MGGFPSTPQRILAPLLSPTGGLSWNAGLVEGKSESLQGPRNSSGFGERVGYGKAVSEADTLERTSRKTANSPCRTKGVLLVNYLAVSG